MKNFSRCIKKAITKLASQAIRPKKEIKKQSDFERRRENGDPAAGLASFYRHPRNVVSNPFFWEYRVLKKHNKTTLKKKQMIPSFGSIAS